MIAGLIGLFGVAIILFSSELLTKKKIFKGETARKVVHIASGCFIAAWPYFMSWRAIQINALLMLAVVAASRYLRIFHSIHKVRRRTLGELFYPIGILLAALLTDSSWIFTVAVLEMALADGLAAIVGLKWGLKHKYEVLGQAKTYLGSATFLFISLLVFSAAFLLQHEIPVTAILIPTTICLSIMLTAIESLAVFGLDNILVPVVTVVALNLLL